MTTAELAGRLIELCKQGEFIRAQEELYHPDIVSIDPDGSQTLGAANMHAKELRFLGKLEKIHSIDYSEPLIAGDYFTVVLKMAFDMKNAGHVAFEEICVYKTVDGKVVFEQFFRG